MDNSEIKNLNRESLLSLIQEKIDHAPKPFTKKFPLKFGCVPKKDILAYILERQKYIKDFHFTVSTESKDGIHFTDYINLNIAYENI